MPHDAATTIAAMDTTRITRLKDMIGVFMPGKATKAAPVAQRLTPYSFRAAIQMSASAWAAP
jgi:hypothetical protein